MNGTDESVHDSNVLQADKLSKRLTYILRYGARKEGLDPCTRGFVNVKQLLQLPMMRDVTQEQLHKLVASSMSYRGTPRFELKCSGAAEFVRARYGHHMERDPFHEGTKVRRLMELCLDHICHNIIDYEFQGFVDLYLLNSIIHKLKRARLLNTKALKSVLTGPVEHLDLEGVYLTAASLNVIGKLCPQLRVLNLRGFGYLLNDHYMEILLRKLPGLESLNISGAWHLTDRTLRALEASCPNLIHLNASGLWLITGKEVLNLIRTCAHLKHLDIFDCPNVPKGVREELVKFGQERKLTIILKDLDDKTVAPEDPAMVLHLWKGAFVA